MKLFSNEWQDAWCHALGESEGYKKAASSWHGDLILSIEPDQDVGVRHFLKLDKGDCYEIRDATDEDTCRFELSAPRAVWLELLKKGTDPIYLVMRGKLKVVQGSKAQLLPYAKAAKEMLAAAKNLEGVDYE